MLRKRPYLKLILDFDGTLTQKDTLHLVTRAGYENQRATPRPKPLRPWKDIVDAYVADYNRHVESYRPVKQARKSLAEEAAWLNSLQRVEEASAARVDESGIFDEVTANDIDVAAQNALSNKQLQFRSGWLDLIHQVVNLNKGMSSDGHTHGRVEVISVNWSRWFIWRSLKLEAQHEISSKRLALSELAIFANEVPRVREDQPNRLHISNEPAGSAINLRTSGDKLQQMSHSIELLQSATESLRSIYIGDSTTDLQCLAKADIGICIRDEPLSSGQQELAETCHRLKISVKHINEWTTSSNETTKGWPDKLSPELWWSTDFHQISEWLQSYIVALQ